MDNTTRDLIKTVAAGQVRHLLTVAAGYLIAKGTLQSDQQSAFIQMGLGFASWAFVAGWSWWQKSGQALVATQLARLKGHVQAIPPTPAGTPAAVSTAIATAKVAAGCLALLLLCGLDNARAQQRAPQVRPAESHTETGAVSVGAARPCTDLLNKLPIGCTPREGGLTGDPIADLHSAIKAGGAKLIAHLKRQYALAISPGSDGSTQVDPIAAPCAKALVPIVDLVVNGPKATTVAAGDPMALTTDEVAIFANTSEPEGIIVQVEKIRILRIAVQSQSLTIACGPLVQDEVKQAKNIMGGITSLITGAGLLAPIGL